MRISDWSSDVCSSDLHAPSRIAPMLDLHDSCGISRLRFAHPYPDQTVAFGHGVAAHHRTGRCVSQARSPHTTARTVEHQAVVAAFNRDRKSTRLNYSH